MYVHANGLRVCMECIVVQQTATESMVSRATLQMRGTCAYHAPHILLDRLNKRGCAGGVQGGPVRWDQAGRCSSGGITLQGDLQQGGCRQRHPGGVMQVGSRWIARAGSGYTAGVILNGLC